MNINFYLDATDNCIASFNNMTSNPFKIGEIVELTVGDLCPKDYEHLKGNIITKLIDDNKALQSKLHLKGIKLVREKKYIDIKPIRDNVLTIDYYCVLSK